MYHVSCTNTHHDVIDLPNHGMVKNTMSHDTNTHHDVTDLTNHDMVKNTKT